MFSINNENNENDNNEGVWTNVTYKSKNKYTLNIQHSQNTQNNSIQCKKCEITKTITHNTIKDEYKNVSIGNENVILSCILDKIKQFKYAGAKFIILPENNKYQIEVIEYNKKYVILKQYHLHTDRTYQNGFKPHSHRYVRITW